MGTRSYIARQIADDRIRGIYCHWDGYPEHVGQILHDHYQDVPKIDALLALGSISQLAPEIGEKHPFDGDNNGWVVAYGRDRGEEGVDAVDCVGEHDLRHTAGGCGAEYVYLHRDGQWLVAGRGAQFFGVSDGSKFSAFGPLTDVLAKVKKEAAESLPA